MFENRKPDISVPNFHRKNVSITCNPLKRTPYTLNPNQTINLDKPLTPESYALTKP